MPMPVPQDDVVCRFIDPLHWSEREGGPKENAFKPPLGERLSVWHEGRLSENESTIQDLKIKGLSKHGHVCHNAMAYHEVAKEASTVTEENPRPVEIKVELEFRPEDEFVDPPWRKWAQAHCQVEAVIGPQRLTGRFHRLMAARSKHATPPPQFAK